MTLHLDLPQSIEQQLAQAAAQHHMPVDAYVLSLLGREMATNPTIQAVPEDFSTYLKSLALFVGNVPNYPADFWTREIVSPDEDEDRHLIR